MRVTLILLIIADISVAGRLSLSNLRKSYFYKTRYPRNMPRPRVLHGQSAAKDEYPYVVSLIIEEPDKVKYRSCTGSLITDKWILTAGHCIVPDLKFVKCGNMSISWQKTECKSEILEKISHPSYFQTGFLTIADIGLVRINEVMKGRAGRLHAADGKTLLGRAVRFAGFGMTYYSYDFGPKPFEDLEAEDETREIQTGDGVIFDVNDFLVIAPKCINIRHGPYFGDSGGPLFVDGKIAGVLSTGLHDHRDSKTLVNRKHPEHNFYTPISVYLDWIRLTINNT
ncbi:chymotrypsin-1-like [Plodia interpunctella]|uniref:chymotrypsin-1-like n=1 Tax=Plodia interpunctella TaxID=58824 RepID=UPI0023685AB5|nr:chymotrypsin-1-like [Plodia interpunctella]